MPYNGSNPLFCEYELRVSVKRITSGKPKNGKIVMKKAFLMNLFLMLLVCCEVFVCEY